MTNFLALLTSLFFIFQLWGSDQQIENFNPTSGTLIVNVSNINELKGDLRLGIYTNADSYDAEDNPEYNKVMAVDQLGTVRVKVDNLPFGKYAIAMVHDVNGNGDMDFNFVGIPKEPYGFSIMKSRFKKPKFSEVQFNFSSDQQEVKVEMTEW